MRNFNANIKNMNFTYVKYYIILYITRTQQINTSVMNMTENPSFHKLNFL